MQPGSNPALGFSFGANVGTPGTSATSTPAFGSTNPGGGFSFDPAKASSGFSFSTPNTNMPAPVFGTPTTNPPAYGTQPTATGSIFGTAPTSTIGFGTPSRATGPTGLFSGKMTAATGQTGLFSGKMVAPPTTSSMFGSTPVLTQNSGGFGGQQTNAALFSANQAKPSSTFFSGNLQTSTAAPALQSGGTTTPFSGFAVPLSKPTLNFGATTAQASGISFSTSPQVAQGSTTATAATKPTLSFGTQETVTATAKPGFSFGPTGTAVGGTPAFGTGQTGGSTFGGVAATTKPSGTSTQASSGLTLGGTAVVAQQAGPTSTAFKLGGTPVLTGTSSGYTLGGATIGVTSQAGTTSTGFKLGSGTPVATTQQPVATGFKLGGTPATQTPSGFTFGGATPASTQVTSQPVQALALGQSTSGFNFSGQLSGQPKTVSTATVTSSTAKPTIVGTNLAFGASVKSTIPGSVPVQTTTSSTAKTSTFGLVLPSTTAATGFQLGGAPPIGTTTSATSGFKLPTSTSIASTAATSGATTTTTTSSEKYTYKQLEEQVNKWNIELEEMEKAFLEQAAQVNVADRELMDNGEKIAVLNNEVERAKAEQNRLDQELDFLVSQQNELEDLLKPLEESVKQHSAEYSQEPDREREKIYTMAEKCDGQLKGMVHDLREIIDYLNASNANQQQEDNPVIQIAKILNVHMDSLQWIDQNSAILQKRVDEIARLGEMRRKEHERSFRLGFD